MRADSYFRTRNGAVRLSKETCDETIERLSTLKRMSPQQKEELKSAKRLRRRLNKFQRQLDKRPVKLEYVGEGAAGMFRPNRKTRWAFGYVVLISVLLVTFTLPKAIYPVKVEHGFIALSQKPGSVPVYDSSGELKYFSREKYEGANCERTVFYQLPAGAHVMSDSDEVRQIAYALYETGNLGMMVADYSGYYSVGTAASGILGKELPLKFDIIDIRNNLTGEAYRKRIQINNLGKDDDAMLALMMTLAPMFDFDIEIAERRYFQVDADQTIYQHTASFNLEEGVRTEDWSKLKSEDSLKDRKERVKTPIPYTSAAYKGKEIQLSPENKYGSKQMYYDTVSNFYGDKYNSVFGDIGSIRIPIIRDCQEYDALEGRLISYEKTDQHIYFGSDPDSPYNNIKQASVRYDAKGEYYEVHIIADCQNLYTSADTWWALRDSKGSGDPNANFDRIEIAFQLWDNGYFKQWEMWEHWYAAKGMTGAMYADQYYLERFTYFPEDCSLDRFDFWSNLPA